MTLWCVFFSYLFGFSLLFGLLINVLFQYYQSHKKAPPRFSIVVCLMWLALAAPLKADETPPQWQSHHTGEEVLLENTYATKPTASGPLSESTGQTEETKTNSNTLLQGLGELSDADEDDNDDDDAIDAMDDESATSEDEGLPDSGLNKLANENSSSDKNEADLSDLDEEQDADVVDDQAQSTTGPAPKAPTAVSQDTVKDTTDTTDSEDDDDEADDDEADDEEPEADEAGDTDASEDTDKEESPTRAA